MEFKKINSIAKLIGGYPFKSSNYVDNGLRVIRIANVQDGYISDENPCFYPLDYMNKIGEASLKDGDLLMSLTGNVGRVAFISEELLPAGLNQRVECIRPFDTSMKKYLYYYFLSDKFRNDAEKYSAGSAQLNMSTVWLGNYLIPIFPKKKQNDIVLLFDNLYASIGECNKQLSLLDELVKSRFVEMFNGKDYPILPWNEIFNTKTGKLDSNAMVEGGQYPFFTCAKEVFSIDTCAFDQEALLLAGNNAAGKYDVKYYKGKFNAYQRTYVLSLKSKWSYRLFKYQLEEKLEWLRTQSKGSNTRYITMSILSELSFIVPPLNKQEEFDQFVEFVDTYRINIQKQLNLLNELLNKKMNEYFGDNN